MATTQTQITHVEGKIFMEKYLQIKNTKKVVEEMGFNYGTMLSHMCRHEKWYKKNEEKLWKAYKKLATENKKKNVETYRTKRRFSYEKLLKKLGDKKEVDYSTELLNILAYQFNDDDFIPSGRAIKRVLMNKYGVKVNG